MKPIGGYFGLELSCRGGFPHSSDGPLVNSGRNALEMILRELPADAEVLVPKFTCEVVLEPFARTGVRYRLYDVDPDLQLPQAPVSGEKQYILYTNYFGIKDGYVDELSERYGRNLIVDNSQALFHAPVDGCNAIYSHRKFVGVPDGGQVIGPVCRATAPTETDSSNERCSHLLKRIDLGASEGYRDFSINDGSITGLPPRKMSPLTERILRSIDWDNVKKRRRDNFRQLHSALGAVNTLRIPEMDTFECPMVYPFRTTDLALRQRLIHNKIFVATYWPNVLRDNPHGSSACDLAQHIIPLPIDQRYGKEEMDRIISVIDNA